MLVTQSTLVGYTMINGTFSLQFALLVASIYNVIVYPDVLDRAFFQEDYPLDPLTPKQIHDFNYTRRYRIPITHAFMMIFNFITNNPKVNLPALK